MIFNFIIHARNVHKMSGALSLFDIWGCLSNNFANVSRHTKLAPKT